jgi:DNA-binding NtrC family response regulator
MISPLRKRYGDIPAVVNHFIDRKVLELGIRVRPEPALGAIEKLKQYHWPGNARELDNCVEKALFSHRGEAGSNMLIFDPFSYTFSSGKLLNTADQQEKSLPLNEMIFQHIKQTLKKTEGKIHGKGGAAQMLGINLNTLRSKMSKLGISFMN